MRFIGFSSMICNDVIGNEGNILMCLDESYLTTIWLMMCNNYFRYGNTHLISKSEFKAVKEKYQYQEHGVPFQVFGESLLN